LKLGRAARKQLDELIAGAVPLKGDFFRSVAFHYFHPDDVISGEGTRLNGGRFVAVGAKAVYARDHATALLRCPRHLRDVLQQLAEMGVRRDLTWVATDRGQQLPLNNALIEIQFE
jgi:RES domain-containing protein